MVAELLHPKALVKFLTGALVALAVSGLLAMTLPEKFSNVELAFVHVAPQKKRSRRHPRFESCEKRLADADVGRSPRAATISGTSVQQDKIIGGNCPGNALCPLRRQMRLKCGEPTVYAGAMPFGFDAIRRPKKWNDRLTPVLPVRPMPAPDSLHRRTLATCLIV